MRSPRKLGMAFFFMSALSACAASSPAGPNKAACPEPASPVQAQTPASTPIAPSPLPPPTSSPEPANTMVHAIFDAGSSGLRLQIFEITRRPDGSCQAARAPIFNEKSTTGGLADMTIGKDPAADVRRMHFPMAESVLAGLWSKVKPEDKARISGVALLGTGGFRDIKRIQKGARAMMRKLDMVIAGWKKELGKPIEQDWHALTIEGEEEATLAWTAAGELGAKPARATIETGGQTTQIAFGDSDGWTAELGTNAVKDWLLLTEFASCKEKKPLDANACIAAFGKRFAESAMVEEGLSEGRIPEGGELWAMGGSWENVFIDLEQARKQSLPEVWDESMNPPIGAAVSVGELYDLAKKACSDRPPKVPGPQYEPSFWCMRLSHAVAFSASMYVASSPSLLSSLSSAKGVPEAIKQVRAKQIRNGRESFTRGAAVSGHLFGECAVNAGGPTAAR